MARATVGVRDATPDDMPALVDLWSQLRQQGLRWRGRVNAAEDPAAVEARFKAAMADPAYRLIVAHVGEEIAGMALLSIAEDNPLRDVHAMEVTHVCVGDRHRRLGAGKALMTAAVGYADERGIDHIAVSVLPQQRDAHRFYARLGFAPVAVRRVAPVAAVRRRLMPTESRAAALRRELRRAR